MPGRGAPSPGRVALVATRRTAARPPPRFPSEPLSSPIFLPGTAAGLSPASRERMGGAHVLCGDSEDPSDRGPQFLFQQSSYNGGHSCRQRGGAATERDIHSAGRLVPLNPALFSSPFLKCAFPKLIYRAALSKPQKEQEIISAKAWPAFSFFHNNFSQLRSQDPGEVDKDRPARERASHSRSRGEPCPSQASGANTL